MAASIVVDIVARDLISPVINNIRGSYIGNLGADLTMAALNGVLDKVRQIGSAFEDAAKLQTKFLADAGSFSATSGLGLQQSKQFMEGMNIELSKLAATLPGATKDYTDFANSINGTLVRGFNVKTPEGLKAYQAELTDITKQITILGQSQNIGAADNALFANRFLGGASLSELRLYQFAERNSAFLLRVKEELKRMGVDEEKFRSLSVETKAKILKKVSGSLVTPELVNELRSTADAMLETIKTSISDPIIGIFGFLRKVKSAGDRSVLDAFTGFLGAWMRLGETIAALAKAAGIGFDPLKPLIDVLDFLADVATQADLVLSKGVDLSQLNFGGVLGSIVETFTVSLSSQVKAGADLLTTLDTYKLVKWLVGGLEALIKGAIAFAWSFDYTQLGRLVGLGLVKAVSFMTQALIKFDYTLIPKYFALGILTVFKLLGGLLLGVVEGIIQEIPSFLQTWADKVLSFFRGILDLFVSLKNTVEAWVSNVAGFFRDPVGTTQDALGDFAGDLSEGFNNSPVGRVAQDAVDGLQHLFTPGGTREGTPSDQPKAPTDPVSPLNLSMIPKAPVTQPLQMSPTANLTQPLQMPKDISVSQTAHNFSPILNIYTEGQVDPEAIAQSVSDRILAGYKQYVQGQLA